MKETPLQKQIRVEKEFQDLGMGASSHSLFHALWERKLLEMEIAGVEIPPPKTLFRRYLEKLPPELHRAVLSKTFSLNNEIRRPETWQS